MTSNHMDADEMRASLGIETAVEDPTPEPEEPPAPETPVVEAPSPEPPATPKAGEAAKPPAQQAKKRERYEVMEARAHAAEREAARLKDETPKQIQARERQIRDEYERRIADLQRQYPPQREPPKQEPTKPADDDPKPNFNELLQKYANEPDPYVAAVEETSAWRARQEFKTQQQKAAEAYEQRQQEQRRIERDQHEQARLRTFGERMQAGYAKNPELKAQLEADTAPMLTRPMMDAIVDSEIPDQMSAYLVQHPEEATRIRGLHPLQQFRAMARIEYQLESAASLTGSAAPEKPKTSAHPPVSPVSGSHAVPASGEPDPRTCTQEEFDAYWNAQERTAGARR